MALLNFQERFADDVESGKKRQTIRKQRKRPFKLKEILYLYVGLRTKKARRLMITKCKSLNEIKIYWNGIIFNGETKVMLRCYDEFAKQDGFSNYYEMTKWFSKTHGLPFEGILIKW